jgi:hypothetical protein
LSVHRGSTDDQIAKLRLVKEISSSAARPGFFEGVLLLHAELRVRGRVVERRVAAPLNCVRWRA